MWPAVSRRLNRAWPAIKGRRTDWETIYDIAAMGAIWIGAFIFFRVAIPDAVGALLADEAGNLLTAQNGDFLAAEPNAFQIAAHNRYLWWGDLAMAFVTIGSIMQVKAQGR